MGIEVQQDGLQPEYSGDNSLIMEELKDFQFTGLEDSIELLCKY